MWWMYRILDIDVFAIDWAVVDTSRVIFGIYGAASDLFSFVINGARL